MPIYDLAFRWGGELQLATPLSARERKEWRGKRGTNVDTKTAIDSQQQPANGW
jgi:hypothetical protein